MKAALDYLLFGTVFVTASKPGRPAAGGRRSHARRSDVAEEAARPGGRGMTLGTAGQLAGPGAPGLPRSVNLRTVPKIS